MGEGGANRVIPAKGASKSLNTTTRIECSQPGHLWPVDVLSAESAQEQSPGRKPRVGNLPSWVNNSPVRASEKSPTTCSPHPPSPSPGIGKGWRHDRISSCKVSPSPVPIYRERGGQEAPSPCTGPVRLWRKGWGGGDIYFRGRL